MVIKSQFPHKFYVVYHPSNKRTLLWATRIKAFIKKRFPDLKIDPNKPDLVIVLGGDGTILEAARKYHRLGSVILGLNLGNVGFLASVRQEKDFLKVLDSFLKGKHEITERMMVLAEVERKGKIIFRTEALNEVVIKNPLGMVELEAKVSNHPVQHIRGTGLLVATATGSTAYNLSAHGPIVMPDIKCLIITELLDHNIPSPSLIIKRNRNIILKIKDFRKQNRFIIKKTGETADVVLTTDTENIISLQKGDKIIIRRSERLVRFAELEKNYFFKSLQEKFAFR